MSEIEFDDVFGILVEVLPEGNVPYGPFTQV